jgi:nitrite reductase (cytochrome c-552)
MPFMSEGGQKYTDHHVQSPLNNVANSCQVCHREETDQLIRDVFERQDRIIKNRDQLEVLLVRSHVEAKLAWDLGANDDQMALILQDIRHAQWRWDYAAASHGGSFHSPLETSRVIATGINTAQEGRIKLSRLLFELGHTGEVPYPDIATKAKAQAFIGMDAATLKAEKAAFLESVTPQWDAKAAEREAQYPVKSLFE